MITLPHWTHKQLLWIFLIACAIFSLARWDSEVWLTSKLDAVIQEQQLPLHYASAHLQGLSLVLSDVSITTTMPKTLHLDELELQAHGLGWLLGDWSVRTHVKNDFMDGNALLSQTDEILSIEQLQLKGDISAMQTWLAQPLPAQLSGQVKIRGDLRLSVRTGQIQETELHIDWQKAAVNMMQQVYALGDYGLQLRVADAQGTWNLHGGKQLKIEGHGAWPVSGSIETWPLAGEIAVKAGAKSPLAALLPKQGQHIKLAGTLSQPRW